MLGEQQAGRAVALALVVAYSDHVRHGLAEVGDPVLKPRVDSFVAKGERVFGVRVVGIGDVTCRVCRGGGGGEEENVKNEEEEDDDDDDEEEEEEEEEEDEEEDAPKCHT